MEFAARLFICVHLPSPLAAKCLRMSETYPGAPGVFSDNHPEFPTSRFRRLGSKRSHTLQLRTRLNHIFSGWQLVGATVVARHFPGETSIGHFGVQSLVIVPCRSMEFHPHQIFGHASSQMLSVAEPEPNCRLHPN